MAQPDPLPAYVAFMVRLPHTDKKKLQSLIEEKCKTGKKTKYLLASEIDEKGREHFHGIIICTSEDYDKIQRHFRETWKLKGQAKKNGIKENGRIRNIRNRTRMLAYTIKDKNVTVSKFWNINLKQYEEIAFQKCKDKGQLKQLRDKALKDKLLKETIVISTQNIKAMPQDEFDEYNRICQFVCNTYIKYHYKPPVINTINQILVRYGVLDIDDYVTDHLSRWFNVRRLRQNIDYEQIIINQVTQTLTTLENYYLYK